MKILVAVDKSEESQLALRYTCHLLEHFDADVDALYVKPDVVEMVPKGAYAPFTTRNDMEQEMEAGGRQGGGGNHRVLRGLPGRARSPATPGRGGGPGGGDSQPRQPGLYDMIVLGAHGRSSLKGLFLGAVPAKVLHHARQPVLIVRNFREIQRILVAYRGSRCDQGALEFIAPLFARKKPEITILHVQETQRGESEEFAEACVMTGEETLKE